MGSILRLLDMALWYVISVDVVLCLSMGILRLDIALQYYTGEDATRVWFMDSMIGQ